MLRGRSLATTGCATTPKESPPASDWMVRQAGGAHEEEGDFLCAEATSISGICPLCAGGCSSF